MRILVTGAAGYVGSIIAEELLAAGYDVIVMDNLQQGHRKAVPRGADFVLADVSCRPAIQLVFDRFHIDAVIHMAAETVVEYSMSDPRRYFSTNVVGGLNLLDTMLSNDIRTIIFSSSAAVYGEPDSIPIDESHPKNPTNAYGESKWLFERILDWYHYAYHLKHVSLRYFNAAGASDSLGEDHDPETHLVPNVLRAALENHPVPIYGTDYPTGDGTCVRDYVHVRDIAAAHISALQRIDNLPQRAFNLGNERGYSVMEVIKAARDVTGLDIAVDVRPRRAGDPAQLVASSNAAKSYLDWRPSFPDLEPIVGTAWQWLTRHPQGYDSRTSDKPVTKT